MWRTPRAGTANVPIHVRMGLALDAGGAAGEVDGSAEAAVAPTAPGCRCRPHIPRVATWCCTGAARPNFGQGFALRAACAAPASVSMGLRPRYGAARDKREPRHRTARGAARRLGRVFKLIV